MFCHIILWILPFSFVILQDMAYIVAKKKNSNLSISHMQIRILIGMYSAIGQTCFFFLDQRNRTAKEISGGAEMTFEVSKIQGKSCAR